MPSIKQLANKMRRQKKLMREYDIIVKKFKKAKTHKERKELFKKSQRIYARFKKIK